MLQKDVLATSQLVDAKQLLGKELGITAGSRVADLGCGGSGYFTFAGAELVGEKGLVYAVDVLKNVLTGIDHYAKMKGINNIKTVWTNLEHYGATKINDGEIDFAFVVNVLFQNKELGKVLREIVRMLRKGGKLLIVDWKEGRFPLGPPAGMRIHPEDIQDKALAAGLKKIKDVDAGKYYFAMIFERI